MLSQSVKLLVLAVLIYAITSFYGCSKKQVDSPAAPITAGGTTLSPTTYYVSGTGNDASAGKSPATAFRSIQKAADLTVPGDIVIIMAGDYPVTKDTYDGSVLTVTRSGSASGGYITYKADAGVTPRLLGVANNIADAIIVNASYIIIDGLEVAGGNNNDPNGQLGAAQAAEAAHRTGGPYVSKYNINGVAIGTTSFTSNPTVDHVEIRNCQVHDFPGGGISASKCDYVTLQNNSVYNTSWYTMNGTSGISVLTPFNLDPTTGYKIKIINNICYNNYTQVLYQYVTPATLSDGNGIILDINDGHNGSVVYTGRTLVENNICYNNGAGGIHDFYADHVDIINNTSFNNEQKLAYANIDVNHGNDVVFLNNIAYAKQGGHCNGISSSNAVFNYNIYWNGTSVSLGANDKIADPGFSNPASGDFKLNTSPLSPAIDAGTKDNNGAYPNIYPLADIRGIARPQNGFVDCGAYEILH